MGLEARALLATWTVSSTADDGSAGTLRWAINQANADNGADAIVFSSRFDNPQTITLTAGHLALTDPATTSIVGTGARRLIIGGGRRGRVFEVRGGSPALSNLTIAGGRGGLRNDGGTLSLTDVVIRGNSDRGLGGSLFHDGTATLDHVIIEGNGARGGGHNRRLLTRAGEAWSQCQATTTRSLQGTWTATAAERDGTAANDVVGHRLTFTRNRFQIRSQDGTLLYAGTVRVAPGAKPAAVDFKLTEGALRGTVWKGIHALDGHTLTTCDNAPDPAKGRPAAFEAESGSGYVLITFTRTNP
jgi:uncharacterized protein (TIGR03067 family)